MTSAVPVAAQRWTWFGYAYAGLVVVALGYFLLDLPIQVTDSYGNLVQAADGTLGSLVYRQFYSHAYLRPLLWAHIRVVYDLSGGHYFEWFRGWHVAQVTLLAVLFVRLLRPRSFSEAAVVPLGLAGLIGIHTFRGTVVEAFPINTFMTILLCCFLAADLALGPPRWWSDVAAAVLLVFAALTVETGLLVVVVFVAAFLAGAPGVSRRGIAVLVLLVAAYFVLRFVVLDVGAPGLDERSSGFGFSTREPRELAEMFGARPVLFYGYNVLSSLLSVLLSEPRGGIFVVTRDLLRGEPSVAGVVNVIASSIGTLLIGGYFWHRRAEWFARRFSRGDQLVIIFVAVALANASIGYAYTKDVIMSPAGAFFAVAMTVATQRFLGSASITTPMRKAAAAVLLLALSATWTFRAVGTHVALRETAPAVRDEWVYVDAWLEDQHLVPSRPFEVELKRHLQDDAIWKHPARTAVTGDWVEWFAEE